MEKCNIELRKAARKAKIPFWAVAEKIGISESQISRNLRRELPERDKQLYLTAIYELSEEQNHESN